MTNLKITSLKDAISLAKFIVETIGFDFIVLNTDFETTNVYHIVIDTHDGSRKHFFIENPNTLMKLVEYIKTLA